MSSTDIPTGGDYVDAGAAAADAAASSSSTKMGRTFFGICDMRIATFFVNVISIMMNIISLLVAASRGPMFWKSLGEASVLALPGFVFSALGIYGAIKFEWWAVAVATAGFIVSFIVDAIMMQWLVLPILALVIYPHAILTYELRTGIMTEESYKTREEFVIPEGKMFVETANSYIARKPSTSDNNSTTATI